MGWITQFYTAQDHHNHDHNQPKYPTGSIHGLLTQNTRGFREETRELWFAAWKERVNDTNINCILIQETHVGTLREAADLQRHWARAWGRQHDPERPLSFWSVADTASVGVAILLRPDLNEHFMQIPIEGAPGRVIAVASTMTTIVNVYAPNTKNHRELFFSDLERALPPTTGKLFVAGDFNCVLDPDRDRSRNRQEPTGTESEALSHLAHTFQLQDTCTAHAVPHSGTIPSLTYFQPNSDHGARLDRCYVPSQWRDCVTGTQVAVPKVLSDHLGFITWLRDPAIQPKTRPLPPLLFPIYGRHQDELDNEIKDELERIFNSPSQRNQTWDATLRHIGGALREIKQREKRQARRSVLKWERKLRKRIQTRQDLME